MDAHEHTPTGSSRAAFGIVGAVGRGHPKRLGTTLRAGLLAAWALAGIGCAVNNPAGWPTAPKPTAVVSATPFVMYGKAPLSWDLPGGEKVRVDVDRAGVVSGMGLYAADIAFTASLGEARIRCESEPGQAGFSETRFGCWSVGGVPEALAFRLAPGRACPARHAAHVSTLTTPACWDGELTVGEQRVSLSHGHLKSTGSPIGRISWLSSTNELLLAANTASGLRIELYSPAARPPPELERKLVLMTVALAWWEHASQPD